jgi:regulator of protease activity HflC (stomatin/prohibitin superfamily)
MLEKLRFSIKTLLPALIVGAAGYALYQNPPVRSIDRGDIGLRANRLTGDVSESTDGSMVVVPLVHELRVLPLRDQVYRPAASARADGPAPFQSLEGLSLGVDVAVRYAVDRARLKALNYTLTESFAADVVEPAVQGVVYKTFARYTVREIFSTKRAEIQAAVEKELAAKLAADGLLLRGVVIGKVDLPADYRRGMEALLAEELASEKMRYTAKLREQRAEATALEQVIAAKGQEEAMKHVLPFKQRQIEQRKLEAEAERTVHLRRAETSAQARKIEAGAEAEARQKLAEAEAYRLDKIGRVNAEQMEREGALVTRHPLLIQKTLADKLSDKIQVIIAPAPGDDKFIGATLLGRSKP